jgi:hypothetical protein
MQSKSGSQFMPRPMMRGGCCCCALPLFTGISLLALMSFLGLTATAE